MYDVVEENRDAYLSLIVNGYLEEDFLIAYTYVCLRTLLPTEAEFLKNRYKYLGKGYNFDYMIDVLSCSIKNIGGFPIDDKDEIEKRLRCLNATVIYDLYQCYSKVWKKANLLGNFVDDFLDSDLSRNYWLVFRQLYGGKELNELKNFGEFQIAWVLANYTKDMTEKEIMEWSRIEFMSRSICAFINPKAYNRSIHRFDIVGKLKGRAQLEQNHLEEMGLGQVETVNIDEQFIKAMGKKQEESKEDYTFRVNEQLRKHLSEDIKDDHTREVRKYEIGLLIKLLLKRRKKIEIIRFLKKKRLDDQTKEDVEVLEDSRNYNEPEDEKEREYYYEGVGYYDIVSEKAFGEIPKDIKKQVFDDVMNLALDLESASQKFLKNLSKRKPQVIRRQGLSGLVKEGKPIPSEPEKARDHRESPRKDEKPLVIDAKDEDAFDEPDDDIADTDAAMKALAMEIKGDAPKVTRRLPKPTVQERPSARDVLDRRNRLLGKPVEPDDDPDQFIINSSQEEPDGLGEDSEGIEREGSSEIPRRRPQRKRPAVRRSPRSPEQGFRPSRRIPESDGDSD